MFPKRSKYGSGRYILVLHRYKNSLETRLPKPVFLLQAKYQYEVWFYQLPGTYDKHCVKSVRIRSYSGPYLTAFGLIMEKYIAK